MRRCIGIVWQNGACRAILIHNETTRGNTRAMGYGGGFPRGDALEGGVVLRRRYEILRLLSCDDFEQVYLARDTRQLRDVIAREYFPAQLSMRAERENAVSPRDKDCGERFFLGSDAFIGQYRALIDAAGSQSVLSVYDAFFENGTAYAISEPLSGLSLTNYLDMTQRGLSYGVCASILRAMGDALLVVQSVGTLHYDISASAIFLSSDGFVKLTDFGAARSALYTRQKPDPTRLYADIHALGQTLYAAVTGEPPARSGAYTKNARLPATLDELFCRMLERDPARRMTTVFDFRFALDLMDVPLRGPNLTREGVKEYLAAHAEGTRVNRVSPAFDDSPAADAVFTPRAESDRERLRKPGKKAGMLLAFAGVIALAVALALILR